MSYSKVDDAIRMIVLAGRGALIGKVDIKSAYRIVPIHPSDRHLLEWRMQWRGKCYVDLRYAPCIFKRQRVALFGRFDSASTYNNITDFI